MSFKGTAAFCVLAPPVGSAAGTDVTAAGAIVAFPAFNIIAEELRIKPLEKKCQETLGKLEDLYQSLVNVENAVINTRNELHQNRENLRDIKDSIEACKESAGTLDAQFDPTFPDLKANLESLHELCTNYIIAYRNEKM